MLDDQAVDVHLTLRMSHEERVNGTRMAKQSERAPPHGLDPLVGDVRSAGKPAGKPHASISMYPLSGLLLRARTLARLRMPNPICRAICAPSRIARIAFAYCLVHFLICGN